MSHMIQTVKYWKNSDYADTRVEETCSQTLSLMMRSKQDLQNKSLYYF